ncbi:hypothetical protein COCMIDRAFT_22613 [Bipolaris oryzae ATCC 44560]|uniref:Uncharacterized protein n=1 Tax=Bipolaris oryzae ATCC 44560 TaxID=930090 RepID=W6ZIP5_COCMI|nr:uncharacterized protein COCMIDRAFT_22613 [Bipolaris oryzae ATCC 44560]EUC49843.1 hypothetical protein COCMIDRAFT_22613 [Bipolaris oryzae ATCC 44560]
MQPLVLCSTQGRLVTQNGRSANPPPERPDVVLHAKTCPRQASLLHLYPSPHSLIASSYISPSPRLFLPSAKAKKKSKKKKREFPQRPLQNRSRNATCVSLPDATTRYAAAELRDYLLYATGVVGSNRERAGFCGSAFVAG